MELQSFNYPVMGCYLPFLCFYLVSARHRKFNITPQISPFGTWLVFIGGQNCFQRFALLLVRCRGTNSKWKHLSSATLVLQLLLWSPWTVNGALQERLPYRQIVRVTADLRGMAGHYRNDLMPHTNAHYISRVQVDNGGRQIFDGDKQCISVIGTKMDDKVD